MTWVVLAALALQAKSPDRKLEGPAANCGSEIPWFDLLEEAAKRARESGRPVAWWVPTVQGSPMDRKLVVEKYMLAGPFMMPRVVELLSEHFIPLRLVPDPALQRRFGTAPLEFIEPGFVFLDRDLKPIHTADRITTFSEEWFVRLLRSVLRKAGREPPPERKENADAAFRSIREGRPDPLLFATLASDEARYFHGVAYHLAGRDDLGRAEWRKIKEGRWAWKAAAELARDGPFVRGFEVYEALPEDARADLPTSTTLARKAADPKRAVRFLLQTQRASGVWDDSHYNFGGDDSLPNVYMAVTALAALALREWGAPEEVKGALARAENWMKDESRVAADDDDEIVWAYAYRLLYFAKTGDQAMMATLVRKLAGFQKNSGVWQHEYDNPFVTASVLQALDEARKAGADVPESVVRKGVASLKAARSPKGVFAYQSPGRGGDVRGGAGRMPLCELALLLGGQSTPEALSASIDESLRHHGLLERIRKYDDHADAHHNGGFFFWYDQHGRALAARAAKAEAALARQKEIVLSTQEIDGCWVDSHELGRVYGTAMALLTLRLCER
jgi:hypothetical protein